MVEPIEENEYCSILLNLCHSQKNILNIKIKLMLSSYSTQNYATVSFISYPKTTALYSLKFFFFSFYLAFFFFVNRKDSCFIFCIRFYFLLKAFFTEFSDLFILTATQLLSNWDFISVLSRLAPSIFGSLSWIPLFYQNIH